MQFEGIELHCQNIQGKPLRIFVIATGRYATDVDSFVETEILSESTPWNHVARGVYCCEIAWFPRWTEHYREAGYTLDADEWVEPTNIDIAYADPGKPSEAGIEWLRGKGIAYPPSARNRACRFTRVNDSESAFWDRDLEAWFLAKSEDVVKLGELSLTMGGGDQAYNQWRKEVKLAVLSPLQARARGLIE